MPPLNNLETRPPEKGRSAFSRGNLLVLPGDADLKVIPMARRERRRFARQGVRGRRAARRVPPWPLYVLTAPALAQVSAAVQAAIDGTAKALAMVGLSTLERIALSASGSEAP